MNRAAMFSTREQGVERLRQLIDRWPVVVNGFVAVGLLPADLLVVPFDSQSGTL